MNFRTTAILIGLLAVVGIVVLFVRWDSTREQPEVIAEEKTLLSIKPADVTTLRITPRDGQAFTLQKEGADWKLLEPVSAPADPFAVDALIRAIAEMKSRGETTLTSENASAVGLDTPRFTIELTDAAGKTTTVKIGNESAVGGNLYVQPQGTSSATVVSADLNDQLEKPYTAYRQTRLLNMPVTAINQVRIERPSAPPIKLEKQANEWQVVEPVKMPAESSEISSITSAITSLNASEFVPEEEVSPFVHPKNAPRATVWVSKEVPTTQPAATQPAGVTITFGGFATNLQRDVYVMVSDPPTLAKVPATSINAFNKSPLDLRDRRVLDIDPQQVTKIEIEKTSPATTQPTTKPAESALTVIERKAAAPSTQPTTQASTQPTTTPALPETHWALAGPAKGDASEAEVTALLQRFNPLRAQKYMESMPTSESPSTQWTLRITTQPPGSPQPTMHEVTLREGAPAAPLVGRYNDLAFEIDRSIIDALSKDFTNKPAEPPPAEMQMPAGFPALPPGHP